MIVDITRRDNTMLALALVGVVLLYYFTSWAGLGRAGLLNECGSDGSDGSDGSGEYEFGVGITDLLVCWIAIVGVGVAGLARGKAIAMAIAIAIAVHVRF